MNDGHVVKVDSSGIDKLLDTLTDDNSKRKIIVKALTAGAMALRKVTINNFKSGVGNYMSKYTGRPMADGVRVTKNKDYLFAKVALLGPKDKTDFRLKFFELGTAERHTGGSKGHSTGAMKPHYFFKSAIAASEGAITEAMEESIRLALQKLNNE